ncbi:MAG: hypothetical protein LBT40_13035 [Deltaproteobacteria bacterium]|nr:hypothetical protein [Deltaproteobacteria bacterium]
MPGWRRGGDGRGTFNDGTGEHVPVMTCQGMVMPQDPETGSGEDSSRHRPATVP